MQAADIENELGPEWLLPSGNGGYGSGRTRVARSRSYHGLLVAALPAPEDRVLVLPQVDESLVGLDGRSYLLSSHLYAGGHRHPHGDQHLERAGREGDAMIWRHRLPGLVLERRLELGPGNRGRLSWRILEGGLRELRLRPFVAFRSHHGGESAMASAELEEGGALCSIGFEGKDQRLELRVSQGRFEHAPCRHEDVFLRDEAERGLRDQEELQSPVEGHFRPDADDTEIHLDFRLLDDLPTPPQRPRVRKGGGALEVRLRRAMLDFLIHQPGTGRPGIIAGYPWFNEWGRDTMIALPGLARALDDEGTILAILEAWAERLRDGLLPNRLAEDAGEVAYNCVDAPLFFLRFLIRWAKPADRWAELPARVLAAGAEILECYHAGTRHGIGVDPEDGLLRAGDPGTHLTWMDAFVDGEAVTPRFGKCVELQALYLDACHDAARFGLDEALWKKRRERLAASFRARFLDGPGGGLEDCVDGDLSLLRANQLIALASDHLPLTQEEGARIFAAIAPRLWTPLGPRSLALGEPGYQGRYGGGPTERDRAYHQGTVWPWLVGPFVRASFKREGESAAVLRRRNVARLASALSQFDRGMPGQLSELCEGDPPHRICGAPAQAWSVAEVLDVLEEFRLDPRPMPERGSGVPD